MTKDNELKKLTGSRHANHHAPQVKFEAPVPPYHLDADELVIWSRCVQLMTDMKIITPSDYDLLSDYATLRSFLERMIASIKEKGLIVEVTLDRGIKAERVNPLLPEMLKILPFVSRMRMELGLSPESRMKRQVLSDITTVDQLDSFLDEL